MLDHEERDARFRYGELVSYVLRIELSLARPVSVRGRAGRGSGGSEGVDILASEGSEWEDTMDWRW